MKVIKHLVLLGALVIVGGCSSPPSGTPGDANDVEPEFDMELEGEANSPSSE